MIYAVEVVVVGHCTVHVEAPDPDRARAIAAECVTPLHAETWEYVPESAIGSEAVREVTSK